MASASQAINQVERSQPRGYWLFSARADLGVFLGSFLLSLMMLAVGAQTGVLYDDTPDWAWVPAILLIDVAHVWATGFRVYLDTDELKRRPWLYVLAPVLGYFFGVALYSEGDLLFWRCLAYLAVFHFVRQQYGWVALYRARAGEKGRAGKFIDTAAVYGATIYPLIYWHANMPREFSWFVANDFTRLPELAAKAAEPVYWTVMLAYASRSLYRFIIKREANPGKDIVVLSTAVCWYIGIVAFNSDYAFTVTNVIIHGVPYLALIYWYGRGRLDQKKGAGVFRVFARGPAIFLAIIWSVAFAEEMFWDRGVWGERSWLFGGRVDIESVKMLIIPLLALPQITHYVLDGFIWRRRSNPTLNIASETRD
jgi:hypothetical protein